MSEAPTNPQNVLVVDDNRDNADGLTLLLRARGHDARAAYDGESALAVAAEFRPAVALLDLGMPEMDGYEIARRLRRLLGAAPVLVAVTGWVRSEDVQRAVAAGFDHHLAKPVDPVQLSELLSTGRNLTA